MVIKILFICGRLFIFHIFSVPLLRTNIGRLHGLVEERILQLYFPVSGALWGSVLLLHQRYGHQLGTREHHVWLWCAELSRGLLEYLARKRFVYAIIDFCFVRVLTWIFQFGSEEVC